MNVIKLKHNISEQSLEQIILHVETTVHLSNVYDCCFYCYKSSCLKICIVEKLLKYLD